MPNDVALVVQLSAVASKCVASTSARRKSVLPISNVSRRYQGGTCPAATATSRARRGMSRRTVSCDVVWFMGLNVTRYVTVASERYCGGRR